MPLTPPPRIDPTACAVVPMKMRVVGLPIAELLPGATKLTVPELGVRTTLANVRTFEPLAPLSERTVELPPARVSAPRVSPEAEVELPRKLNVPPFRVSPAPLPI